MWLSWQRNEDQRNSFYFSPSSSMLWGWVPVVGSLKTRGLEYFYKMFHETLAVNCALSMPRWPNEALGLEKSFLSALYKNTLGLKINNYFEQCLFPLCFFNRPLLIFNKALDFHTFILYLATLLISS